MSAPDSLTVLRSLITNGAVKSFSRTPSGDIAMTPYQKPKQWRASSVVISSFDEMAKALVQLVDDQSALVVRGALKPGIDLSQPILRRIHGDKAALDDVPRRWLHLDIDRLAAPHVDVVGDPSGAIDFALDALATAAPELDGMSCFAAFSSQAGVFNTSAAKLHLWFWLDRHYSNAELKRWAEAVNERAGLALIDLALFNAAQANYTARPLFEHGAVDPLPGTLRWSIRHGFEDETTLVIPETVKRKGGTAGTGKAHDAPVGGWVGYLNRIDGDGLHGLYRPAFQAMASRIAELGAVRAEAERGDIIATVAARLEAAPVGGRPAGTVERYIADLPRGFDYLIDRQRESDQAATLVAPTYPNNGVPADEAEKAVAGTVAEFFAWRQHWLATGGPQSLKGTPLFAVKLSTGIGKTEQALQALAARPELRAAMLVPRHKLTDELLKRAAALGIDAASWRGREARNPAANDGSLMCIEPEIHEAAKKADLVDEACKACPSRPHCPFYLANDREPARLEIAANNFLSQAPPSLIASKSNKVDVLIVDEAFIDRLTDEPRTLLLDALSTLPDAGTMTQVDVEAARAPLRRALRTAFEGGQLIARHLFDEGINEDTCRQGEATEWAAKPKAPKLDGIAAGDLVSTLRKYAGRFDNRPALLWRALGQFLAAAAGNEEAEAGAVEVVTATTDGGDAPAVRFRIQRKLHETWADVPRLILDAETLPSNAELEALFGYEPHRVEVSAEVPTAVTVHQLVDPLPISALVDREGAPKPKLVDVADRVELLVRKYAGHGRDGTDVLAVGGTTAIADALRAALTARGLDVAPKEGVARQHAVEVRHCGDLAGEDRYGGVRALVQVGWSLPPARALERDIGGATGIMPKRLPGEAWAMAEAGLRLRDGSGYRVSRPVHPDPAVEELRRRKTEGEAGQALGRARWTRRTEATPLDLLILSPLPQPEMAVDQVLRWSDVAVPRWELAFWRLGGVLPCRPADLVLTGLWPTERAAKEAASKGQFPFILDPLRANCTFEITPTRYRRVNQSRWSSAVVGAWLAPEVAAELLRAATRTPDLIVERVEQGTAAPEQQAGTGAPPPLPPIVGSVGIVLDPVQLTACGTVDQPDPPPPRPPAQAPVPAGATVDADGLLGDADDPWDDYDGGVLPGALAALVRSLWRSSPYTQQQLADRVGISRPQLANALQGRFGLSAGAAARLRSVVVELPRTGQERLL